MDMLLLWLGLGALLFTTISAQNATSTTNQTCKMNDKNCTTIDCKPGYYGNNCTLKCGMCSKNKTCSPIHGECNNGCSEGYIAPLCQKSCSNSSYGFNCSKKCGFCRYNKPCSSDNGKCITGCQDGYTLPFCQKKCNTGYYGQHCKKKCGLCRNNTSCSPFTGNCTSGCKDFFIPPLCQKTRPYLESAPYIIDLTDDNKVNSETMATMFIPTVKNNTRSENCSVYIIVSVINSILKINLEKSNNLKQIILNHSHYQHAWIAKELLEINKEQRILLGNEEKFQSQQLGETIINYKLEPFTNYEVVIVVINKYNDEILSNVFYTKFQTALKRQSHLYIYIVLLIIPYIFAIGSYIYIRHKKKKNLEDNYIEPNNYNASNTYIDNNYLQIIDNAQNENTHTPDDEYDSLRVNQNADYVNEAPQEDSDYDEVRIKEPDDSLYDIVKDTTGSPSYMNLLGKDNTQK